MNADNRESDRPTEQELFDFVMSAKADFGTICKKYTGAVFAERLRSALKGYGIITSARDVFIEKVPIEIDLLIATPTAVPRYGVLYRAEEVLVAFEVKSHGLYGEKARTKMRAAFGSIRQQNPNIACAYVSLTERIPYKWQATEKNIVAKVFRLLPYRGTEKNPRYVETGDWAKLLAWLNGIVRTSDGSGRFP
jgi:hypothetical protein